MTIKRSVILILSALCMKIIRAAAFVLVTLAHAGVTTFPVIPASTDPEIKHFNGPHWVYVNRDIVVQHQADMAPGRQELLLWLTGTGDKGRCWRLAKDASTVTGTIPACVATFRER